MGATITNSGVLRLVALSLAGFAVTFVALWALRGGGADADPLVRAGWAYDAVTPGECDLISGLLQAWERTATEDFAELQQLFPGTVSDEEVQLHREWVADEAARARAWIAEGCPRDGIRGAYYKRDEPERRYFQFLEYQEFRDWAMATGRVPPGTWAPSSELFRTLWQE